MLPSQAPSITGLIASFDITKVVTSQLADEEINGIEAEIINNFDVTQDEVDTAGNYYLFDLSNDFELLSNILFNKHDGCQLRRRSY